MAELTEKEKKELEEQINVLDSIRGRHTELVTVLIPPGQNINLVQKQLEAEKSTAANIKSKATRSNVSDALDMIIRNLKEIKKTPENGLALFAGNVSEKPGSVDIKIWVIEPPKALNVRTYRCDQTFVTEPLKSMLEVEDLYGLLVIDRQQATLGLLEGKQIKVLRTLTSGVPGKVRAGGQCLSPDTLIMKDDGELIEIKDSHNPLLVQSENFNIEKTEKTPLIAKWENKKELFKITTCYPKFEIKSSKDHTFFVRTDKGIEEKPLSELKESDYLIMPEKINLDLKEQTLEFKPEIKQSWNMKKVDIPKTIDEKFSKILGYYLGDGSYEIDRISFSEHRKEVAEYYKNLIDKYFNIESRIRFRENKGYYQLRAGSRIISQLFKSIFKEKNKTLEQGIPPIIMRSPDKVLAQFISGFFDAEGYVSKSRAALGINNKLLTKQLQFCLLRLGIISSINTYDNRMNPYSDKTRYTLAVDDLESLKKFKELIGFTSKEKETKLKKVISGRSSKNKVRQIAVNGAEVARILRNSGLNTRQFGCPYFFTNKRQMSKEIFKKRILDKLSNSELKRRLEMFYLSNLIAVKISKIEPLGKLQTIDIETKNHNFIANGLIVHNSSQRFHRITENLAKEFFRRVSEAAKELFFDLEKLRGLLIGGPIPTKEEFLEEGQLATRLKEKVIAVKDIGYVDEHGLELLVEDSWEDIAQQELIKEKKILERFFDTLGKNPSKAAYGLENVKRALERGAVEVLLVSKSLPSTDLKDLEVKAESIGSEVVIVSEENQDGEQFQNLASGVGAILRFAIE